MGKNVLVQQSMMKYCELTESVTLQSVDQDEVSCLEQPYQHCKNGHFR